MNKSLCHNPGDRRPDPGSLGACAKPVPPAGLGSEAGGTCRRLWWSNRLPPPPPTREQLLGEYVDKVRRLIRGHMLYKPKTLPRGNPETLVEVVLGPDLRVRSVKTVKVQRCEGLSIRPYGVPSKRQVDIPDFPAGLDPAPFQTHKIKYRLHDLI